MVENDDTIIAAATPAGHSAVALVRASGPACARVAAAVFGSTPPPRVASYRDYLDRAGTVLDDVLVTYFPGPRSYTGEECLEIATHGNPLIVATILKDLQARGCRIASPGEFTRRAFLQGRMDLAQAEAVMDLIHARSERALEVAGRQLRGALGRHLQTLTEALLVALARVEAYIDFPEEDLPAEDRAVVTAALNEVLRGTSALLATRRYGELLREGIGTVILGAPNAGKSSLLNRLLGRDRAIVSPEPGTTRDYLEERMQLGPHGLRLIDTAGLNPTPGAIEQLGIGHTAERAAEADLFLWVLDATVPSPTLPDSIRMRMTAENTVVVFNKSDLLVGGAGMQATAPAGWPTVPVSTLTGDGLEALIGAVTASADRFRPAGDGEDLAVNARHADALERARLAEKSALAHLQAAGPTELLASDLREALAALGEIGGKFDNEAMLDRLFQTFCIGK